MASNPQGGTLRKYGDMSPSDWASSALVTATTPLAIAVNLITSPWTERNKHKTWGRIVIDSAMRWSMGYLPTPALQRASGNSLDTYITTVQKLSLPVIVDDLTDNAKLMWVGEKRTKPTDRVILYFHGGAFLLPLPPSGVQLWRLAQEQWMNEHGENGIVGIAILNYTLAPTAMFPTPLIQAVAALNYLLELGVRPENIIVAGDSAGGNLVLQLLSHLLHPMEGAKPVLSPNGNTVRLKGALMISPWVEVSSVIKTTGSSMSNSALDFITPVNLAHWGAAVSSGVSPAHIHYLNTTLAPAGWFAELGKVVQRVCVTVGEHETLLDEGVDLITRFDAETSKNSDEQGRCETTLLRHPHGVHVDMYLDLIQNQTKIGEFGQKTIGWVWESFSRG